MKRIVKNFDVIWTNAPARLRKNDKSITFTELEQDKYIRIPTSEFKEFYEGCDDCDCGKLFLVLDNDEYKITFEVKDRRKNTSVCHWFIEDKKEKIAYMRPSPYCFTFIIRRLIIQSKGL